MPFLDHLEELRWRILYSLAAILVATGVGWVLVERADVIALFTRPIAPLLPNGRLMFTSPTEPFFITLKCAFAVGLLLASPVVGYELWAFLAPALYPRERRVIVPALSVGVLLFVAGAWAGYAWVLPRALRVLFSFQRDVLQPIITADNYFAFAAQIVIAFGLITELPLVVTILAALGLVTPGFLAQNRRYAVVGAALLAALLSPPDAVSMLLMLLPLWLLYEVSILCAWVVTRRRHARVAAARDGPPRGPGARGGGGDDGQSGGGGAGTRAVATALVFVLVGATLLSGQIAQPDTTRGRGAAAAGAPAPLDTAAARKLGLPTAPTRSFPASDAVMDSLMKLRGFRVTQYVADTLIVKGDSQAILLQGEAFVDRQGTKVQADSIHYYESSCRLDAQGTPQLFDQSTVMVGDVMHYDTCIRRGIVSKAFTDFREGGVTWYMRGDIAVDSGATRLYGSGTDITSDDQPRPDYHFGVGRLKWLSKHVMVARPAVLYVRDVPILWLPFILQDVRPGRRSGLLVPGFGPNDLVRPNRSYSRHFTNLGYYWAINDYLDALVSADWYAGENLTTNTQVRYHWLNQFMTGSFAYSNVDELSAPGTAAQISWQHTQSFNSNTSFNASVNYATSGTVLEQNSVNPFLATAQLTSQLNFDKRFDWGTLNIGGSRSQDITTNQITQTFPTLSLTPTPINFGPSVTWSPGFSYENDQTFHQGPTTILTPGVVVGTPDCTCSLFYDTRNTAINVQTPVRFGRWNWTNSLVVNDQRSNQPLELDIADSTVPGGLRRNFYGETFETTVDWETGINLPPAFPSTWKLQPGLQVVNATTAGPTGISDQYSDGQFIYQGKRLELSAALLPTLFGFFPGVGPIDRIRHSIAPVINIFYASATAHVPAAYSNALDPADIALLELAPQRSPGDDHDRAIADDRGQVQGTAPTAQRHGPAARGEKGPSAQPQHRCGELQLRAGDRTRAHGLGDADGRQHIRFRPLAQLQPAHRARPLEWPGRVRDVYVLAILGERERELLHHPSNAARHRPPARSRPWPRDPAGHAAGYSGAGPGDPPSGGPPGRFAAADGRGADRAHAAALRGPRRRLGDARWWRADEWLQPHRVLHPEPGTAYDRDDDGRPCDATRALIAATQCEPELQSVA